MKVIATKWLNSSVNIQVGYDLLSQEPANNRSLIRTYLVMNVNGTFITWTRGYASVQGSSAVAIGTYYTKGSYTLVQHDLWIAHDINGNFSGILSGAIETTHKAINGVVSDGFSLPQIKRNALIIACDDTNDEQIPFMVITNPANYILNLRLEFPGFAIRRDGLRVNGRYDFILTEDEKNLIYERTKEQNSVVLRYCAATTYDGVNEVFYSFFDRTLYIVQAPPDFKEDDFEYEDINSKTLAITNNNKVFIENYSNLQVKIKNPMRLNKKSEGVKYQIFVNSNNIKEEKFKLEEIITNIECKKEKQDDYLTVKAIDSRKQETIVKKKIKIIPYSKPKVYLIAGRLNNFEEETTIKINGEFSSIMVEKQEKNTIKEVKFRYKEINGEFNEWKSILFTLDQNKFTCKTTKLILNREKKYVIEVIAEDKLSNSQEQAMIDVGITSFFISTNKNAIAVNCIPDSDAKAGEIYYETENKEKRRVLDYQKQGEIVQFKDRDELVYPKMKREILMVKKTSEQNLNINFQIINFDEIEINNTDKLTYKDGIVSIKKDVKKISINAHIFAQNAFNAYLFGFIRKNENGIQEYICEGSQNFKELNVSSLPIEVKENDKIYLLAQINKPDYGQIRSGYLSIEILE